MFGDSWIAKDREYRLEYFRAFEASGSDFSKLTALGWAYVLCVRPELSEKCPWDLLNDDDSGSAWHCLLMSQPQFAEKCAWRFAARWNDPACKRMSKGRWHWDTLLARHPQFADKCDWLTFDADDLEFMARTPELVNRFELSALDGAGWVMVLRARPELASKCNWGVLKGEDWVRVLTKQPQLAQYCAWDKLDGLSWGALLHGVPQFAERCPWHALSGTDWGKLLSKAPEFVGRCDLRQLDKNGWQWLVYSHKEFRSELEKLSKYTYEEFEKEYCEWYEDQIGVF